MDEIVKAALKKWPNVPHVYGWLALDARGDWYLRDGSAQAAGPFPRIKGSRIEHERLREFIARNYAADDDGAWFFQNGPQRVYVELEAAPWTWRVTAGTAALTSHTGLAATAAGGWQDEHGRLFVASDLGLGLVHTQDMDAAADVIEHGLWPAPVAASHAELVERYGFQLRPTKKPA